MKSGKQDSLPQHTAKPDPVPRQNPSPYGNKRRFFWLGVGILLMVLGFGLLPMTDPMAENAASLLVAPLIIGGILIVLAGFLLKDGKSGS